MSIKPKFNAGSTGVMTASFVDETGAAVTPNEASWTLKQNDTIVNNRVDVAITPLSPEVDIVLSGDDLISGDLCLIVNATYDSSLGSDLPLKDWSLFSVIAPCD